MITNEKGEFSGTLKELNNYEIKSGLPTDPGGIAAISFSNIFESGASLSARSPFTIDMNRNITLNIETNGDIGDVCLVLQNNQEMVFFGYNNTTSSIPGLPDGAPIDVPLSALNQIYSPVGNPIPAPAPDTLFAIGNQGFTRKLLAFATSTGTYAGIWKFLGLQAIINGRPKICPDQGDAQPCTINHVTVLNKIWRYASRTVADQIELANSLAGKRWTPNPSNRLVITKRGAIVLAALRAAIAPLYDTYTCEVVAAGCRTIKIDKDKIRVIFSGLYTKVPKGLESLGNDKAKRKKYIDALLKKLPTEVTSCHN